ncbi:MAG: S41 family peptidase [Microscillaceae bacterium]|nr:S41 family peptidase [Microscillaceae bacterium]MDW8460710.1 S41 family peptidase [Cytophagales bacterium]
MSNLKNSISQIRLPFIVGLTLACGILIGATLFGNNKKTSQLLQGYAKFKEILGYIDQMYVDTVNTEELTDYAIEKMLEKLDPHSVYIPAKNVQMANMQLEGDFEGIGIEFNIFRDTIIVVAPISGGPSEQVGLQSGDKIIKVDGKNVAGIKIDNMQVFKLLRGKKGTKVNLEIKRKNSKELLNYTIIRDKIPQHSVDVSYMIDKKTGYIKVSRFAANTYREFKEALEKLKAKGMQQLLIDLRDNPGGYLDRAYNMADELLDGNKMIVYTDGRGTRYDQQYRAHIDGAFEKGAVVILIDEGSASASEILAGAIQDNDRGLIVGRRSFGKGLVQAPIDLSDGSELRLTISRYYTPSGRSIQKPYSHDGKKEDYNLELYHRFQKGEFFSADSIKVNEKLKYKTSKGRIVYGGGGIVPDVFVPLDTTENSKFLNELYSKNILREFCLNYANDNKATLSKMKFSEFRTNFQITDQLLNSLVENAKKSGAAYSDADFQRSKELIRNHMKAFIARSLYGQEGFFPIWLERDKDFQTAIKLFDKAREIEQMK